MNKIKIGVGILTIVMSVILISGCTTSQTDVTKDIVLDQSLRAPPQPSNGLPNEYVSTCNIHSITNTPYSSIQLRFTAYDANNNTVGNQDVTVNDMKAGQHSFVLISIKANFNIDHVGFQVLNATKA